MSDNAEARARAKRWVADQDTNPPLELAFFSGFEEGQALLLPEIAALREAVRDLEYANAMFTHENKSFREAIIGMEGGLNIADSWRTHPTVLYVLEGKR